jgi:hypothetical protein
MGTGRAAITGLECTPKSVVEDESQGMDEFLHFLETQRIRTRAADAV